MSVTMLRYRGDGAFRPGLPPRDLDRADLEALAATSKRAVDAIVDEATGSGLYLAVTAPDDPDAQADGEGSARKDEPPADPLEDPATTRPMLVEMAAELELTVASRDTKATIADAIRAERQRRADEAAASAADQASSSGASDQGGKGTPADDPDAQADGEAGTPPDEGAGA